MIIFILTIIYLLGVTQIIGTLTATALMDKFGRRFLLLGSSIMMIIFLTVFGTYQNYVRYDRDPDWMEYMGLVSILMFSLSFSLGEGTRLVPNRTCSNSDLSQFRSVPIQTCPNRDLPEPSSVSIHTSPIQTCSLPNLTNFQDLSLGWSLVKCSMPGLKGSVRPSVLH